MDDTHRFARELEARIEAQYQKLGFNEGWRLLYSPERVLDSAEVAFIGINPGGKEKDSRDHARFAMPVGQSAYVDEKWSGKALQRQAREVMALLDVEPTSVLAGNAIPFRSKDWEELAKPKESIEFGTTIWSEILNRVKPKVIITYGNISQEIIWSVVGHGPVQEVRTGWGDYMAKEAESAMARLIHLPHLSTFKIFGRGPKTDEELLALMDRARTHIHGN